MDGLDWSSQLKQHEQVLEESLIMPSSNGFHNCEPSGKLGIIISSKDTLINPAQQIIQKDDLYNPNFFSHWNVCSSSCGVANNAGLLNSCTLMSVNDNPFQNGLVLDPIALERMKAGISTNAGSLESLDCLLSASNSQIDTGSIEDDGVSALLSGSKSLWNFTGGNGVVAVKSFSPGPTPFGNPKQGENADPAAKSVPPAAASLSCNNANRITDNEAVSQTSADGHAIMINYQSGTDNPGPKPVPTKKRRAQSSQQPSGLTKHQNLDFLGPNYSTTSTPDDHEGTTRFQLISENQQKPKKPRLETRPISSSNISFQQPTSSASSADEPDPEAIAQMKEMIYRAAAFRPVNFGTEVVEKPKRKNVRISSDPQTMAARQRREKISERIRVLQRLVPGGSKMDTASMLDEAANYLKFLRSQVKALEALGPKIDQAVDNFPDNANLAFSPFFYNYSFAMQQPEFSIQGPSPVNQS